MVSHGTVCRLFFSYVTIYCLLREKLNHECENEKILGHVLKSWLVLIKCAYLAGCRESKRVIVITVKINILNEYSCMLFIHRTHKYIDKIIVERLWRFTTDINIIITQNNIFYLRKIIFNFGKLLVLKIGNTSSRDL